MYFFWHLSYSHISSPPVPFLLPLCSPALVFWPHNLIFSPTPLPNRFTRTSSRRAPSPRCSPLSFLPYFHLWALSLHPLSPSSPPILICSSLWRKGEREWESFSQSKLLAVCRGRASEEPALQVVHPGTVESKSARVCPSLEPGAAPLQKKRKPPSAWEKVSSFLLHFSSAPAFCCWIIAVGHALNHVLWKTENGLLQKFKNRKLDFFFSFNVHLKGINGKLMENFYNGPPANQSSSSLGINLQSCFKLYKTNIYIL